MDRWSKVRVRTLGGKRVLLKTPYFTCRKSVNQEERGEKRRQQRVGLYPVLWRLGIVRGSTPRFLAEVNRHMTDGPSDREVQDRLGSREIRLSRTLILRHVRDFGSIALWQRQVEAAHLEHVTVHEPAPLAGKRGIHLRRDTLCPQPLSAMIGWRFRGRDKSSTLENTVSKRSGNPRLQNREAGVVPSEARPSKVCSTLHTLSRRLGKPR